MHSVVRGLFVASAFGLAAASAGAVVLGATDTFEDGSTQGWGVGAPSPVPPVNVAGGGPAGAADNHLLATALGGNGPGSRLVVIGGAQWAGNYAAAGVDAVTMDVRNFGATEISLRLALFGAGGSVGVSAVPLTLAAGGGWQTVRFSLAPGALAGTALPAMDSIAGLRIFHGTAPLFPGDAVAAQLGIDNVSAVPEPAPAALLAGGLGALLAWRSRRRRGPSTPTFR